MQPSGTAAAYRTVSRRRLAGGGDAHGGGRWGGGGGRSDGSGGGGEDGGIAGALLASSSHFRCGARVRSRGGSAYSEWKTANVDTDGRERVLADSVSRLYADM